MKQELKALCELQAIDTRLTNAKKALAALDSGAALKQGLKQTEAILAKRTALLQNSEAELMDNELKLKSLETKRQGFEKKLYDGKTTNPKELTGIQQEIEMINRNRAKLDERVLELYDLIEQQKKSVQEAEERAEQFRERLQHVLAQQKAKADSLNAEIAQLTQSRNERAGNVPAQLLKEYDNIRTRAGGIGIASVQDGKCSACHTAVTQYIQRKIREDGEYQHCESCGRFLCFES